MSSAKDIRVAPISSRDGNAFVRAHHYSGKVVNNSQLHLGAFLGDRLIGVMQFGPSLDKRKMLGLVKGTKWNGFIELNRMAMIDDTPRNAESRCIAVAMRLIRQHYPHIEWVVSFADATQCGDGTIYRASGFVLTAIKKNNQIWEAPDGRVLHETVFMDGANGGGKEKRRYGYEEGQRRSDFLKNGGRFSRMALTDPTSKGQQAEALRIARVTVTKGANVSETGAASMEQFKAAGFRPLEGFQLRYIYFLNPAARERLTVSELPFSRIADMGAAMYKGERQKDSSEPFGNLPKEGGAAPTLALQD